MVVVPLLRAFWSEQRHTPLRGLLSGPRKASEVWTTGTCVG